MRASVSEAIFLKQTHEIDTNIKDLEASVSYLNRELSKAQQETNKLRRERDEWERKEAHARKEKVSFFNAFVFTF